MALYLRRFVLFGVISEAGCQSEVQGGPRTTCSCCGHRSMKANSFSPPPIMKTEILLFDDSRGFSTQLPALPFASAGGRQDFCLSAFCPFTENDDSFKFEHSSVC